MSSLIASMDGLVARLANIADDPRIPYQSVAIGLSGVTAVFKYYVSSRQMPLYSIKEPPVELGGQLDPEKVEKAQAYGRDKLIFNIAKNVFNWGLGYALIKGGAYKWAWDVTARAMNYVGLAQSRVITHSLGFVTLLGILSSLPELPWDYYYQFVIEQKHGFNKSTRKLWVTDQIKEFLIGTLLNIPIVAGLLKIYDYAGRNAIPYIMAFALVVQLLLISVIVPMIIQPLFNKFTQLGDGEIRTRCEALAKKLDFPLTDLYECDGSKRSAHSNAYFIGLPWSKRIVLFDTLVKDFPPNEIEAVLAHELGHWKLWHMPVLLGMQQASLVTFCILFRVFANNKALYSSFGFNPAMAVSSPVGGPQPLVIGFTLFQLLSDPINVVLSFFMYGVSRKLEYQADEFAARMGYADEMVDGLRRLAVKNLAAPHIDPLYSWYHMSHPTMPERIRAIQEGTGKNNLIKKQSAVIEEIKDREKKEL